MSMSFLGEELKLSVYFENERDLLPSQYKISGRNLPPAKRHWKGIYRIKNVPVRLSEPVTPKFHSVYLIGM